MIVYCSARDVIKGERYWGDKKVLPSNYKVIGVVRYGRIYGALIEAFDGSYRIGVKQSLRKLDMIDVLDALYNATVANK